MGTGNLLGAVQQPDDDYCSGRWGEISGRSNVDYAYQLIVQVVEEGADRNAHLRWPSLSEKVEDPALLLTPIGAPEGDRPRQRFRPKILIWVTAQARGLDEVVSEQPGVRLQANWPGRRESADSPQPPAPSSSAARRRSPPGHVQGHPGLPCFRRQNGEASTGWVVASAG